MLVLKPYTILWQPTQARPIPAVEEALFLSEDGDADGSNETNPLQDGTLNPADPL